MKKNKHLTIAFVSDAIYPYNKGGKEKRLYEISTRLAALGHDVHIYCMHWWKENKKTRIVNNITYHAISPNYPLYSGNRRSIRQAVLFAFACIKLINEDFDVIDVDHMPHLVLFSTKVVTLLKGKKLITTWNEVWGKKYWKEYLGKLGTVAFLIEWFTSRIPDEIIAVSNHTKEKLIKDLRVNKKITVIPNGIDLKVINDVKPSQQKSDVIFAGRLLSHKNVHFLIAAIHILKNNYPNITCLIIGKGPEEIKLKKLVTILGLKNNIIFYNFLEDHTDVYALMKSSKVFAFPSTREGFGIAALEANASGIPVITIDHKDNATKDLIVNNKNGQLIQLDEKKLAEKVSHYLTSKDTINSYSQIVKKYDWEEITNQLEEVYLK